MLTTEQQTTLRNFVLADPVLNLIPPNADGAFELADALKAIAIPAFIVWRTDVKTSEIGDAWIGTDIDGMSALNMQRLQLLLASSPDGIYDMRRSDRRAGFENPFGSNANNASRVAMRAVWKRSANRLEKLFATGTGSTADPGLMVVEGDVNPSYLRDVMGW